MTGFDYLVVLVDLSQLQHRRRAVDTEQDHLLFEIEEL